MPVELEIVELLTASMAELKSCPFCDETDIRHDHPNRAPRVYCSNCRSTAPHPDIWNRKRAGPFLELRPDTAEIERLRAAIKTIAEGDYPRSVNMPWRKDRKPSKHDLCPHGKAMYEDCGECCSEFARAALSTPMTKGEDG